MIKYAIYGAGAFGQEIFLNVRDIVNANNEQWEFIGFLDDNLPIGTKCKYGNVVGDIDFVNNISYDLKIVIAVGNPNFLKNIYSRITNPKIDFPNIIHPSAICCDKDSLHLGKGNVITMFGIISFDIKFGDFNIFNNRGAVGHHVETGSFNVFHPNVQISGNVKIGDLNAFGLNSAVIPGRRIGSNNTFGPGCIVTRNIGDNLLYVGNPAQKLEF